MLERKFNISQKNLVLFIYVIILIIILPLGFWLSKSQELTVENQTSKNNSNIANKAGKSNLSSFIAQNIFSGKQTQQLKSRISKGEKILVSANNNLAKQAGVAAFADRNYQIAIAKFTAALQTNRNDPEAVIYLNNALAAAHGSKITLGASVPINGNLNVAQEILRGIAQAQQEINQTGGIDGKLVEIKIANDDNDPEWARKIAKSFVADRQVLAVIGHNSSRTSLAAAPIYQAGKLVQISPTSVARDLTRIGDYILRTTPSTRGMANSLARYTTETARQAKVAICHDSQSPASKSFKEEFTLALFEYGGEVTHSNCDFASVNFNPRSIPSQVVSEGAEALLLIPSVNNIAQAIAVAQANQNRLRLLGNHTMYTYETLQQGQVDVNGLVLPVVWHPKLVAMPSFLQNMQQMWGEVGTWRTATSYDATQIATAGMKSEATRQKLQETLTNPGFSFEGATGKVRFLPSGDRPATSVLVKVQPQNNSQAGYDFTFLAASSTLVVNSNSNFFVETNRTSSF